MNSPATLERFIDFSDQLLESLKSRTQVIGLVLLGSTADHSRVDEWSDHDFFVITKEGQAEAMRKDLSWLPNHDEIAFAPRETDHGLKVVFENAHVLEFAVFDDSELELAGANTYAVPLDRTNIAERMSAIAVRSAQGAFDFEKEWQLFLALLLIGVGRARRGEFLIAGQFVRSYCLNHVLGFVRYLEKPAVGTDGREDSFNRFRRFEQQYPQFGNELEAIVQAEVEQAAAGLLQFAIRLGAGHLTEAQHSAARLIANRFGWSL